MEPKKFEYIDSLRGIAILMVIVVHISTYINIKTTIFFPPLLSEFIYNMKSCVSLFFMVSAFTLTLSHQRRQSETHATSKFFIRRFFRVAPFYYLAIIVIASYNLYTMPYFKNAILSTWFLSNITFTNTLSPYYIGAIVPGGWSVSVEFMFYLIFPLLSYKIKNANVCIIFFAVSVTIASLFYYNYHDDPFLSRFEFMELNFYYQLPAFFLGILAYYILKDGIASIKYSSMLIIMAVIILFVNIPMPYYILWSIVFLMLILILHHHNYKAFSNKILSKVGEVSFSMYIIHFFIIILFNKFQIGYIIPVTGLFTSIINYILLYLLVSGISFLLANITYKLIEIPGQNLGKKIIKKLDQQNNITV